MIRQHDRCLQATKAQHQAIIPLSPLVPTLLYISYVLGNVKPRIFKLLLPVPDFNNTSQTLTSAMTSERSCTGLCRPLGALTLRPNGGLPKHNDIRAAFSQTALGEENVEELMEILHKDFRNTRNDCAICQLMTKASALHDGRANARAVSTQLDGELSSFQINLLADDGAKKSGARLAFFTANEASATSPDNARPLRNQAHYPALIKQWLHKCNESHKDCYPYDGKNPESVSITD